MKFPGNLEQTSARAIFQFSQLIVPLDDTQNKHALNARITAALDGSDTALGSRSELGKYSKVFYADQRVLLENP